MGTCCSTHQPTSESTSRSIERTRTVEMALPRPPVAPPPEVVDAASGVENLAELRRLERLLDEVDRDAGAEENGRGARGRGESDILRAHIQHMQRMLTLLMTVGASQEGPASHRRANSFSGGAHALRSGDLDRFSITLTEMEGDECAEVVEPQDVALALPSVSPLCEDSSTSEPAEDDDGAIVDDKTALTSDSAVVRTEWTQGPDTATPRHVDPSILSEENARGAVAPTELRNCVICIEAFRKGDKVRVLPCLHRFHQECVDPWLVGYRSLCPICRGDLRRMAQGPDLD